MSESTASPSVTLASPLVVPSRRWPWRSVTLPCGVTVLSLFVGVPLFLRMPPWCDLTLYDVAARNLLQGGVHYRDVFDTNLPGFVWILTAIRAVFGWSTEAIRAIDLLVVAAIVGLLDRLLATSGATRASRAWFVAGVALFYPFTSEFNHAQRDVWMMLPALAAIALRVRMVQSNTVNLWRSSLAQGVLWGLAFWIKPHVIIPAACVWFATVPQLLRVHGWRGIILDLVGNKIGGAFVGMLGIAYLYFSGTWESFVDVFTVWNPGYALRVRQELPHRLSVQLAYFPPWSYLHLVCLPLALACVVDGFTRSGTLSQLLPMWLWQTAPESVVRFQRLVLATLYLAWAGQALIVQKDLHYVHVPEVFLMLALLSTQGWATAFVLGTWLTLTSVIVGLGMTPAQNPHPGYMKPNQPWAWVIQHSGMDPNRLRVWPSCWRTSLSNEEYYARMMRLAQIHDFHPAISWPQINEIAEELQKRGANNDVVCWHNGPHVVYLLANQRPIYRFQHVHNMIQVGPLQETRMWAELQAIPHIRYVVSDLDCEYFHLPPENDDRTESGPDGLPPKLPQQLRQHFPYDQPVIFRSANGHGRYIIHEVRHPIHPLHRFPH